MKATTEEKINSIKTGKFGVEVEMYDITRELASKKVAEFFGTYSTLNYVGGTYGKWTCRDAQGRKWSFMSDSSIHDSHGGCEMVTPILGYADIELLQDVVRVLRHNGAKSDPRHECGIHVHVDATGYTVATIRNLANLMKSHDNLILNAIGVTDSRRRWCRPVNENFVKAINNKKVKTMEEAKKVWYESQGSTWGWDAHYNSTRYNILNLHSLWQNKGIEFRCFQFDNPTEEKKGGLHAGQLKAYIQLCLAICEQAKRAKYSRNTVSDFQTENPKKAIYKWMRRIGMKGDEFKTARTIFTRNLKSRAQRVAA